MTQFSIADKAWTVVPDGCWVMCPVCRMVLNSHDSCDHVETKHEDGKMLIRQASGQHMAVTLMPWRAASPETRDRRALESQP